MPLNPLTHPVKVFVVKPVYVIISSSIFSNPYFCGNPLVLDTVITSSFSPTLEVKIVLSTITSGFKLYTFKY